MPQIFQSRIILVPREPDLNLRHLPRNQQRIDDYQSFGVLFAAGIASLTCSLRVGQLLQILVNESVEGQTQAVDHVFRRLANVVDQIRHLLFQRTVLHDVAAGLTVGGMFRQGKI